MLDDRWAFNIKHCTTFLFRILPILFSTFSPICIMTLKIVFKRKLFHIEMKIVSHRDDAKIRISSPLSVSILAILSKYSLTPFLCIFSTQYHIQDAAISWSNAFMTNPFLSWKYVTHTHWSLFCSGHQWYLMFQPVKQNFHILSRRSIPITLQSVKIHISNFKLSVVFDLSPSKLPLSFRLVLPCFATWSIYFSTYKIDFI